MRMLWFGLKMPSVSVNVLESHSMSVSSAVIFCEFVFNSFSWCLCVFGARLYVYSFLCMCYRNLIYLFFLRITVDVILDNSAATQLTQNEWLTNEISFRTDSDSLNLFILPTHKSSLLIQMRIHFKWSIIFHFGFKWNAPLIDGIVFVNTLIFGINLITDSFLF